MQSASSVKVVVGRGGFYPSFDKTEKTRAAEVYENGGKWNEYLDCRQ